MVEVRVETMHAVTRNIQTTPTNMAQLKGRIAVCVSTGDTLTRARCWNLRSCSSFPLCLKIRTVKSHRAISVSPIPDIHARGHDRTRW
jgi:hypothetical protein